MQLEARNWRCSSSGRSSSESNTLVMGGGGAEDPQTFWMIGARRVEKTSWIHPPGPPQSSEWEVLYIYDDYLGIFHHQNRICNVSHSTYLAITHLRCQLQTSQETGVLVEFCQQPKKVLKGLAEEREHQRIIRSSMKGHTSQGLLPKCCQGGLININWATKSSWHFTKTAFLSLLPLKMAVQCPAGQANRCSPLWPQRNGRGGWCDYKGKLLSTFSYTKMGFVVICLGALSFLIWRNTLNS